ncbi:uncharacterized protein TNCV_4811881 [Trichonephila clavipes]|nr:uncharacterized protein TNCV_4811881 [Trichonephila clavipes]
MMIRRKGLSPDEIAPLRGPSPLDEATTVDKGCPVLSSDPRPDAAVLYPGCKLGKCRVWLLLVDWHTVSLVGLRGGWRHARMSIISVLMDPNKPCPGKGFVLPKTNVDEIAAKFRYLQISLTNYDMSKKSSFAVQKSLIGIGGETKFVKPLKSGDLLIEAISVLQKKYFFLLAKSFLDSPQQFVLTNRINPKAETLDRFSDQDVIQVRRIKIKKKESSVIPTKHLILTFNISKLPTTVKARYLNCKIRPYFPNAPRCFKCQTFEHSQTSCSRQLTCSRCTSAGHSSIDRILETKCVYNCSQPHPSDFKLCS